MDRNDAHSTQLDGEGLPEGQGSQDGAQAPPTVLTEFARWEGLLKTEPAEGDVEAQKGRDRARLLRTLRDRAYLLAQGNAALSGKA